MRHEIGSETRVRARARANARTSPCAGLGPDCDVPHLMINSVLTYWCGQDHSLRPVRTVILGQGQAKAEVDRVRRILQQTQGRTAEYLADAARLLTDAMTLATEAACAAT